MSNRRESSAVELLLQRGPIAINLGLEEFAEALRAQGVTVVSVDWTPPFVNDEATSLLDRLL